MLLIAFITVTLKVYLKVGNCKFSLILLISFLVKAFRIQINLENYIIFIIFLILLVTFLVTVLKI